MIYFILNIFTSELINIALQATQSTLIRFYWQVDFQDCEDVATAIINPILDWRAP